MKRAPVKVLRHVCMKAIFAVSWCLWFSQWKILSRVQALAVTSWTSKNNVETGNSSSAGLRCLSDFGWRHYIWGWNIILFICFVVQHFNFKTTLSNVAYVEDSGCIHLFYILLHDAISSVIHRANATPTSIHWILGSSKLPERCPSSQEPKMFPFKPNFKYLISVLAPSTTVDIAR